MVKIGSTAPIAGPASLTLMEKGLISPKPVRQIVSPQRQRDALAAVLETLDPKFLALLQRIVDLIPPRAYGYEEGVAELFDKRTAPAFDLHTADVLEQEYERRIGRR